MSAQNPPGVSLSGTGTSAEGHGAASDALSVQKPAFPSMWWSPSEEQWFAEVPGEGLMAFGTVGSLADGLPKDAQRLVSVGPLLELVAELATRQAECVRDDADDAAFAYGYAVRLLASLLPESPTREGK